MRFIKADPEFREIYKTGRSTADRNIVLYASKSREHDDCAMGVSVGKKYGNSVKRHLFKRRFKEISRAEEPHLTDGIRLVVIARTGASNDFSELRNSFRKLAARLRIYDPGENRL
ncbi:MAG: ribonuclease P protein component [Lachnospiraceae bacterium]|nr:ribonuclease P protein component [Lachnospiraceae bacterium]